MCIFNWPYSFRSLEVLVLGVMAIALTRGDTDDRFLVTRLNVLHL